jgi:FkbM family methyltransferase
MADMIKAKLNGRYELILPRHRAERAEWYTEAGWEKERIGSMVDNIQPGDTIYDVGAEEGDISAILAMKAGASGKMVLVEPNPLVWPNMKAIWESNNLPLPLWFVGFFGDGTNESPNRLNFERGEKEGWPISAFGEVIGNHGFRHQGQETSTTPQITMDLFTQRHALIPNLITMDCEGSDLNVLRGGEETLKKYKPLVYVSVHSDIDFLRDVYHQTQQDLYDYMEKLGYKHELLAIDHERHEMFWHPDAERKPIFPDVKLELLDWNTTVRSPRT